MFGQLPYGRQTAPYSPELEPDIILTAGQSSDLTLGRCTPTFCSTLGSQKEKSLYGCMTAGGVAFWMLGVSTYGVGELTGR
jgi:hypothetical protein